jgi:hypothetical protein
VSRTHYPRSNSTTWWRPHANPNPDPNPNPNPNQEQLYYLVAPSRDSALASAYMEALKAKDLEVGSK